MMLTWRVPEPGTVTALVAPVMTQLSISVSSLAAVAAQAFAGVGDEVLMPQFSFAVYPIAARRVGAVPVEAKAKDFGADVDALLAAVTPATRIVFIANPNNPTGTWLPHSEIMRLRSLNL